MPPKPLSAILLIENVLDSLRISTKVNTLSFAKKDPNPSSGNVGRMGGVALLKMVTTNEIGPKRNSTTGNRTLGGRDH